jgi:hypothetical protein
VLLVSEPGNLFVAKVLEANPLVQLGIRRKLPETTPAGTVMVYHRQVPNPLPPGNVLVIDPTNDCDLWKVGDKLQNPLVAKQDKESPLMAHVRLDNVVMPEARQLTFTPAAGKPKVLASALTGEPLFSALERPEGKVLILSVNLDKGDLPLRTAFPILATNALNWFAGARGELREAYAAGAIAEITLPNSPAKEGEPAQEYLLRSPRGHTRPLPPGVSRTTIGPLDECGIWSIVPRTQERGAARQAEPVLEIACNLSNRAESDLRPPKELPDAATETGSTADFVGRPIWFYLLALAWGLAGLEWYLYQRRWIS